MKKGHPVKAVTFLNLSSNLPRDETANPVLSVALDFLSSQEGLERKLHERTTKPT
jgi:hypothetical protein